MDRLSFRVSEDNRRRLEILKAFSVLNGSSPTLQDLVNEAVERLFVSAYENYCTSHAEQDFVREIMEGVLPNSEKSPSLFSESVCSH